MASRYDRDYVSLMSNHIEKQNVIGERPLYYQNNIKLHLHQYSIPVPDLRILKSDRAHNLSSMSTAGSYIEDFLHCKKLRLP